MAPAQTLDDRARLSALSIQGGNGTVFDLSPIFQPDVSQYGAMVGADCKDVTLCFDTIVGRSAMPLLHPEVFVSSALMHFLTCCFNCKLHRDGLLYYDGHWHAPSLCWIVALVIICTWHSHWLCMATSSEPVYGLHANRTPVIHAPSLCWNVINHQYLLSLVSKSHP